MTGRYGLRDERELARPTVPRLMFATTHVVTGAVLGRYVRHPARAFGLGVVSHLALDALPHWGIDTSGAGGHRRFLRVAVADGVLLTVALTVLVRRHRPAAEIAGALGALLLDLDKPASELGIGQLWPDPVHRTHIGIQQWEAPGRWPLDAAVTAAALAVLRRPDPPPAAR